MPSLLWPLQVGPNTVSPTPLSEPKQPPAGEGRWAQGLALDLLLAQNQRVVLCAALAEFSYRGPAAALSLCPYPRSKTPRRQAEGLHVLIETVVILGTTSPDLVWLDS
jgi:hypothetical protein